MRKLPLKNTEQRAKPMRVKPIIPSPAEIMETLRIAQFIRAQVVESALKKYEPNLRPKNAGEFCDLIKIQRLLIGLNDAHNRHDLSGELSINVIQWGGVEVE